MYGRRGSTGPLVLNLADFCARVVRDHAGRVADFLRTGVYTGDIWDGLRNSSKAGLLVQSFPPDQCVDGPSLFASCFTSAWRCRKQRESNEGNLLRATSRALLPCDQVLRQIRKVFLKCRLRDCAAG